MHECEPVVFVCISDRKLRSSIKKLLQKRSELFYDYADGLNAVGEGWIRNPTLVILDRGFLEQAEFGELATKEVKTGSAPWVIIISSSGKRNQSRFSKLAQIRSDSGKATFYLHENHVGFYLDQFCDSSIIAGKVQKESAHKLQILHNKLQMLEDQVKSIEDERLVMTATEKEKVLHQISASINHEINNPLAVILGQIEILLLNEQVLPGIIVDRLEAMNSAGKRIQAITEKLRSTDYSSLVEYVGGLQMIDIRKRKNPGEGLSILVVDDEYYMSELFKEILENQGYRVKIADSGNAAVRMASQEAFNAALVDLKMPGMDGVETIRSLKDLQPDMRIIIHTGYVNDRRIKSALSSGAERLLYKPFKQEYLLELLNEVISKQVSGQE